MEKILRVRKLGRDKKIAMEGGIKQPKIWQGQTL